MDDKDSKISDTKAKRAKDAPPLAAQKHQAVEDAVDPAIAPENKSTVDEIKY
jgi:hypothetical protein